MSKRAIVTGGSGYFGQILVEKLLEESWVVLNIDLNSLVINHPNYSFFKCVIRNYDKLNEYIKESDIIFHCVAQVPLAKNISDFWSVNSNGTENICKIANKKKN